MPNAGADGRRAFPNSKSRSLKLTAAAHVGIYTISELL
jgi:hypothetical protein